jgi:hypothetical protein
MRSRHLPRRALILGAGVAQLVSLGALAAVPTGYKGTPYLGTPQAIPGRVELANMDTGGQGVAWAADHNRMNSAGYEPISGNDYRPDDKNLPNICKTNTASQDTMLADGSPYPSTTPTKELYYIGYAHGHDWVRMTVDVKQAGKYNVSSTWATPDAQWGLSLWFNDGSSATAPMDGVNKSGKVLVQGTNDYHKWKDYPSFTQVDLSAGVQLLTFHLELDHLQYGFLQFDLVGGSAPASDAGAPTGAAGAGAAGTGGATDASATGGAGTGGIPTGAAGAGSLPTGAAGDTGSTTGTAGNGGLSGGGGTGGGSTGAAGTSGGTTTGAAGTGTRQSSGGGCSLAAGAGGGGSAGAKGGLSAGAGLLLLGSTWMARRRRRGGR